MMGQRYYSPELCRFIQPDDIEYLDPSSINGLNLYCYCFNNPIMYADPSGCFPVLACILGLTALVGMGLTIGGVASDNNIMTAIGLTMVAIPALISGGLAAFATTGTLAKLIGAGTMLAGVGTGLFASAEYQESFTGNNWMSSRLGEGWYNGLMIATASLATLGTFASSFAYSFNINSISKIGRLEGTDYKGIRFSQIEKRGKRKVKLYKTLEYHTHSHHGYNPHWQLNEFTYYNGTWYRGNPAGYWKWWMGIIN